MVKPFNGEGDIISCEVAKDSWLGKFYSLVSGRGHFSSLSAIEWRQSEGCTKDRACTEEGIFGRTICCTEKAEIDEMDWRCVHYQHPEIGRTGGTCRKRAGSDCETDILSMASQRASQ